MAKTKYGFRFRRIRFETLDVVVEQGTDEISKARALCEAFQIAHRKRTKWTPNLEPYGRPFIQGEVQETTNENANLPSAIEKTLARSEDGKSYMLVEFDHKAVEGRLAALPPA